VDTRVRTLDYILVAYDVVTDRRRGRLRRELTTWLPRVQKSVFEGPVARRDLAALRAGIGEMIDHGTDSVRLLRLCPRCRERVERFGTAGVVPLIAEDVVIDAP
jgi:CRISPR-associated protein Cas2